MNRARRLRRATRRHRTDRRPHPCGTALGNRGSPHRVRSHQVVILAACDGAITGLFVAGFDRLVIDVGLDHVLQLRPWLIAVMPGLGLLLALAARRTIDSTAAVRCWAADHVAAVGGEVLVVFVSSAIAELEFAAVQINTDAIRNGYEQHLHGDWTALLRERNIRFCTHVAVGRVATELMRVAHAEQASLIVIGMTGRGTLGEIVLGSAEHELLKHAVRPVVAVPAAWQDGPST
jgi:nucleotide-binding universal stress UspA family protein